MAMQGDFSDFERCAHLLQLEEMQQLWMSGATAIAQANYALAHESALLRAIEDNARLQYENRMLRMQALPPPPGLEPQTQSRLPNTPPTMLVSPAGMLLKQPSVKGKTRLSTRRGSDESTAATSSTPSSLTSSPRPSLYSPITSSNDHGSGGEPQELEAPTAGTSAMMRNLPNDYTRKMLEELLVAEGFGGSFDFVYLPMDFRSCSGLGYAFINFSSLDVAEQFREHFTGFNRWAFASDKVCEVTWSSLQGLDAHINRYRNSPVMHESVPEEQKPALFSGSERIAFPAPTKKIRLPRHWHRRH